MNLYESIKGNHNRKVPKRFIKESAEEVELFWDKVNNGEIKVGDKVPTGGAGEVDIIDLDKGADYILIKRDGTYQPFVAAWAPGWYDDGITWGQGHYFDNEDDAKEYFNKKKLGECDNKEIKDAEEAPIEETKGSWLETCYIPNRDTTIIFRHTTQGNDAVVEELVNYYYGSPNENATREMAKEQVHPLVMDMLEPEEFKDFVSGFDEEFIKEACGKKKRPSLKESNPARYLGVKSVLDEAINHANDDINAKIKEALRSKTAARKYKKDLEDAGIKIDDTPREGVNLIGPNGRMLSADRQNIYGPTKPGHGNTHDSNRYGYSINSERKSADRYRDAAVRYKEELAGLESLNHDDIIRKYANISTENALAAHDAQIKRVKDDLEDAKRWERQAEKDIHKIRKNRDIAHRSERFPGYNDTTIPRDQYYRDPKNTEGRGYSKLVDAIDYKGYLDSKDNNENKDFNGSGYFKRTPGQKLRDELKDIKSNVNRTYSWGSDAQRDLDNRAIDAKAIEARKKEIEEEYKKKMDDEVNSMLKKKSDADASYKEHRDEYGKNVARLNAFRAKHNLPARDEQSFDEYIEKRSKQGYWN